MDRRSRKMSDVEHSAVESLISCSEKQSTEETLDPVVVTSNWGEVARGWRNTQPNARYVVSPEKRKKSKDKFQIASSFSDQENQLAKVRKLAGMIASSNIILKEENTQTKHKGARNTALAKYQNCGVLSYDVPCWRFVLDPKHFRYIERLGFLDIRALNDRKRSSTHTILLENGSMITCQEVNGRIALFDPALTFDRHLLETYELREEFRLRACHRTNGSYNDYTTGFLETRTEDNKIRVVQTNGTKSNTGPCSSCEMCRHRTQEVESGSKIPSPKNRSSELKPLQKITPSQKRLAEESRIVGRVLMQHGRAKELSPMKSVKENKKVRDGKVFHSKSSVQLDWLPITRSTIAYPYIQEMTGSDSSSSSNGNKFPDRPSPNISKTYALPRHHTKARKLTLSEAANLVPKTSKLGEAFDKLTKELENKHDKPLSLSEPLLPTVSGTKLEVSISGGLDM